MKKMNVKAIFAIFVLINCPVGNCTQDIDQGNTIRHFLYQTEVTQRINERDQDFALVIERRREAERRASAAVQAAKLIYGEDSDIDFLALEWRLLGRFLAEAESQYQDESFDVITGAERITLVPNVEKVEQDFAEIYSREDHSNELIDDQDRTEELTLNNDAERDSSEEILVVDRNGDEQELSFR